MTSTILNVLLLQVFPFNYKSHLPTISKFRFVKCSDIPTFPIKLKQLRQERGWSQGQLAKKIGSDLQRISKYERGVAFPTTEMAAKIATVFQVSLDYLILDEGKTLNRIQDSDLLKRIEEIDKLPKEDKNILINLMDAYIKRRKFEALAQSEF